MQRYKVGVRETEASALKAEREKQEMKNEGSKGRVG